MKAMTVRHITPALSRALEEEKRRRGLSLNRTVLQLLRQGLGVGSEGPRSNGLAELAGSWSAAELREFEHATARFEQIDESLWH